MKEIWLPIGVWEGYYISNHGRVKRGDKLVALCPNKHRSNYVYVYHHSRTIKPRALSVHRLVAQHFIPNPLLKREVNHIDYNTQNNCVTNLQWVTHQENVAHSKPNMHGMTGDTHPCSVLSRETVLAIVNERRRKNTKYRDLAKKYKTNYSNIAHILRGSRWGSITKIAV